MANTCRAHECVCVHVSCYFFRTQYLHLMQQTATESGGGKRHCRHHRR